MKELRKSAKQEQSHQEKMSSRRETRIGPFGLHSSLASAALPWICVAIVFVMLFAVFCMMGMDHAKGANVTELMKAGLGGAHGRAATIWAASAFAVALGLIWNIAISVAFIWRHSAGSRWSRHLLFLIVLILSCCSTVALCLGWKAAGEVTTGFQIVIEEQTGIPLRGVLFIMNTFAFICIWTIVGGVSAILLPLPHTGEVIERIEMKVVDARTLLYSASTLLVLGVIEMFAQYSWPCAYSDADAQSSIYSLASSLSLGAGVVFSALLLSLFLPLGLIQGQWIRKAFYLAQDRNAGISREDWLKDHGIAASTLSAFAHVGAVLAPVLVGILSKSLGDLLK